MRCEKWESNAMKSLLTPRLLPPCSSRAPTLRYQMPMCQIYQNHLCFVSHTHRQWIFGSNLSSVESVFNVAPDDPLMMMVRQYVAVLILIFFFLFRQLFLLSQDLAAFPGYDSSVTFFRLDLECNRHICSFSAQSRKKASDLLLFREKEDPTAFARFIGNLFLTFGKRLFIFVYNFIIWNQTKNLMRPHFEKNFKQKL